MLAMIKHINNDTESFTLGVLYCTVGLTTLQYHRVPVHVHRDASTTATHLCSPGVEGLAPL